MCYAYGQRGRKARSEDETQVGDVQGETNRPDTAGKCKQAAWKLRVSSVPAMSAGTCLLLLLLVFSPGYGRTALEADIGEFLPQSGDAGRVDRAGLPENCGGPTITMILGARIAGLFRVSRDRGIPGAHWSQKQADTEEQ